jgi:hypothetical protein
VFANPIQQNLPTSGGIRLVRSMGAWEQRVAYGTARANLFPYDYEDGGFKNSVTTPQILALTGDGSSYGDFEWTRLTGTASRTPGLANVSQVLDPITLFFTIYSIVGENGSHDLPDFSVQIAHGGSTQIVYTADQWFRIATCTTNGTEVAEAIGGTNYLWNIDNAQMDYSNEVTFVAATAEEAGIPASVDPDWARGYYAYEGDAAGDASLAVDYLLNLNPTVDYAIGLNFSTIAVADGSVSNQVVLTDSATNLTTTIHGVLKLQGKVSLDDPEWTDIDGASYDGADFVGGIKDVNFADGSNKFFRAVIVP